MSCWPWASSPSGSGFHLLPGHSLLSSSSCPSQGQQPFSWSLVAPVSPYEDRTYYFRAFAWISSSFPTPSLSGDDECTSPATKGVLTAVEVSTSICKPMSYQNVPQAQPPAFLQVNWTTVKPAWEIDMQWKRIKQQQQRQQQGQNPFQPNRYFTQLDTFD